MATPQRYAVIDVTITFSARVPITDDETEASVAERVNTAGVDGIVSHYTDENANPYYADRFDVDVSIETDDD